MAKQNKKVKKTVEKENSLDQVKTFVEEPIVESVSESVEISSVELSSAPEELAIEAPEVKFSMPEPEAKLEAPPVEKPKIRPEDLPKDQYRLYLRTGILPNNI